MEKNKNSGSALARKMAVSLVCGLAAGFAFMMLREKLVASGNSGIWQTQASTQTFLCVRNAYLYSFNFLRVTSISHLRYEVSEILYCLINSDLSFLSFTTFNFFRIRCRLPSSDTACLVFCSISLLRRVLQLVFGNQFFQELDLLGSSQFLAIRILLLAILQLAIIIIPLTMWRVVPCLTLSLVRLLP